jgi:hypothetical protein
MWSDFPKESPAVLVAQGGSTRVMALLVLFAVRQEQPPLLLPRVQGASVPGGGAESRIGHVPKFQWPHQCVSTP